MQIAIDYIYTVNIAGFFAIIVLHYKTVCNNNVFRTQVDRIKKTKTRTLPSAPLELMIQSHFL